MVLQIFADGISARVGRAMGVRTIRLSHGLTVAPGEGPEDLDPDVSAPRCDNVLVASQGREHISVGNGGARNLERKLHRIGRKEQNSRRMSPDLDRCQCIQQGIRMGVLLQRNFRQHFPEMRG